MRSLLNHRVQVPIELLKQTDHENELALCSWQELVVLRVKTERGRLDCLIRSITSSF